MSKLLTSRFFDKQEIQQYSIFPICPECDNKVELHIYDDHKELTCLYNCKSYYFNNMNDLYHIAKKWNNFIYKKRLYTKSFILLCIISLIVLFINSTTLLGFILSLVLSIIVIMAIQMLRKNKIICDMKEEIDNYNLHVNHEIEKDTITINKNDTNKTNVEILKNKINLMNDIICNKDINDKLKNNITEIINIANLSIKFIEDNGIDDKNIKKIIERFEQLESIINAYLQNNKYSNDTVINDDVIALSCDLITVFQCLYNKLLKLKEFDTKISLKVIQKDIDDFKIYNNL